MRVGCNEYVSLWLCFLGPFENIWWLDISVAFSKWWCMLMS
jgi:hypothetical protein